MVRPARSAGNRPARQGELEGEGRCGDGIGGGEYRLRCGGTGKPVWHLMQYWILLVVTKLMSWQARGRTGWSGQCCSKDDGSGGKIFCTCTANKLPMKRASFTLQASAIIHPLYMGAC